MTTYLYLDSPSQLEAEACVLAQRPGAVLVDRSLFFPGGGGQLADKGRIFWSGGQVEVEEVIPDLRGVWLQHGSSIEIRGGVVLCVDQKFRALMSELHTIAHVVNSVVFANFGGALLTGAQLAADGTIRLDFDLPDIDNDRLRKLEGPINAAIKQDLPIRTSYMPWKVAEGEPGIFRSKSVTPPQQEDGNVRIVEIVGLDRQACGGTHLSSTGQSRPIRILKVDNKGRHNRRIRVGLVDAASR